MNANNNSVVGMATNTVLLTMERYQELMRKEIGFDYRKAELEASGYIATSDRIMFGIEERKE